MEGEKINCTCPCEKSVFDKTEKSFSKPTFPNEIGFLNSNEKWGRTVIKCYCLHRILNIMECIFNEKTVDIETQKDVVTSLSFHIGEVNPSIEDTFIEKIEEDIMDSRFNEYDIEGRAYLFSPPMNVYQYNFSHGIVQIPKLWTKLIVSVKNIDNYRCFVEEINSWEAFYGQKWLSRKVLYKFNRDLVYYKNMCCNLYGVSM